MTALLPAPLVRAATAPTLPDALRILVLGDEGGARSLRQLTSLRVVDLKAP